MGKTGVQPRRLHHVVQELANFPDARVDARMLPVIIQQPRVTLAHEDHAAGRRAHDIVVCFEQRIHAFRQRFGVFFETRIGHRLTAAGLVQRIVDLAADLAQQLVRRPPHLGIDRIDVTGNEQSDFHLF